LFYRWRSGAARPILGVANANDGPGNPFLGHSGHPVPTYKHPTAFYPFWTTLAWFWAVGAIV